MASVQLKVSVILEGFSVKRPLISRNENKGDTWICFLSSFFFILCFFFYTLSYLHLNNSATFIHLTNLYILPRVSQCFSWMRRGVEQLPSHTFKSISKPCLPAAVVLWKAHVKVPWEKLGTYRGCCCCCCIVILNIYIYRSYNLHSLRPRLFSLIRSGYSSKRPLLRHTLTPTCICIHTPNWNI